MRLALAFSLILLGHYIASKTYARTPPPTVYRALPGGFPGYVRIDALRN